MGALLKAPEGTAARAVAQGAPAVAKVEASTPLNFDFDGLVEKIRSYHPSADVTLLREAFAFAVRNHDGQTRKSGDPYVVHPASVATIIADMRLDTASVCAALLHDVVEDTEVTTEQIADLFGQEISFLVDGVTKLGRINFTSREDQQAESFRKMVIAMARDIRVLLVKLADRLDNMRTLDAMKEEAQERIARETLEIYAPLAGRLGIQWLKAELEDLSFSYLHPDTYQDIHRSVERTSKDSDAYIADVSKKLRKMLIERGFAADVYGRVKHVYSIHRKMKLIDCSFDQVHDFIAFRVLMENVGDCYAALGVVHSEWTPVPGRFKDYIALPKPNLYQSLHTTVIGPGRRRIEVQIRTQEMHRTAEHGVAAHWRYKERTGGLEAKDAARFAWIRQLMEFQQEVRDPAEFLESVKVDLFPDDVYVFTPRGDVKTFPRGSTPIDFAYSVHSEVGHHCAGARVNGALVSLRHKLHNGDVVEILTRPDQHPSKDWLDYVGSARARSRVRAFLREEERKRSIRLGKDLLEREMRKAGLSFTRFAKSSNCAKSLEEFRAQSLDNLCAQIGYGRLSAHRVVESLVPKDDPRKHESLRPSLFERTVHKVRARNDRGGLLIEGVDDMLVRFAKCCTPLAGDPVTGWITRGRGVTVHRRECPRALELDTERRVEVAWAPGSQVTLPVALRVMTDDRPGILADVSAVLSGHGVNIAEARCQSLEAGRAQNTFLFSVAGVVRLREIMRQLERIEGVLEVERT